METCLPSRVTSRSGTCRTPATEGRSTPSTPSPSGMFFGGIATLAIASVAPMVAMILRIVFPLSWVLGAGASAVCVRLHGPIRRAGAFGSLCRSKRVSRPR